MLHNTGLYGPNEAPVNMGAPVNMTPMSGHMNIAHNINNLGKIAHQGVPASSAHYNLPDYAHYNHPSLGMSPQMGQFPNYQQLGFQHSYMNQNANNMNDLQFPNGMFPMNLNIQNEHNANMMNYAYDKRIIESVRQENFIEQNLLKMPLNIPQIPNKNYIKQIGGNDDYVQNNMYQETHHNLDLSMKAQEKIQINSTRRKNIENTVKLIENILIHSSNKPREVPPMIPIATKTRKADVPLERIVENVMNISTDIMEPNTDPLATSPADLTVEEPKNNNDKSNPAENDRNDNKKLENDSNDKKKPKTDKRKPKNDKRKPKNDSKDKRKPKNDSNGKRKAEIDSNDKRKPEIDSNDKRNPEIVSNDKRNSENNINDKRKPENDESSDEEVKPIGMTQYFIREQDTEVTTDNSIVIKVEKASWADSECYSPFLKDCHGFQRDEYMNYRIIEGDCSVAEAINAYTNAIKPEGVFECPHCAMLFKHPKRFVIHCKWHTFGLTSIKRMEIAKIREQKRFERKEAKIIERINSKEVTDVEVDGKVFPCKDCDKIFSAKGSLKNHRQRSHQTRVRECRICHKVMSSCVALRAHLATHSADSGLGYQCSECPKRFKYSHSLAKHSDTHLEKVHACKECPKKFGSQALLKMHMKTHERVLRGPTYRCTYCGKGFFESYSLQVHERTHRNERPFACDICNTTFGTNSSLKRHVKVSHNTAKQHQCTICRRNFSTASIRDRHELRLHGSPEDFKFPCKQCSCKYLKLQDLQKHVYKMHPKGKRKKKVRKVSDLE